MKRSLLLGAAALLMLTVEQGRAGVVVWDTGPSPQQGGNHLTLGLNVNQFQLSAATDLTDVRFWQTEVPGNPAITTSNSYYFWRIYADNAGTPGAELFTGIQSNFTRTDNNPLFYDYAGYRWSSYVIDFSIDPGTLGAGTYWFGLSLSTSAFGDVYWDLSSVCGSTCADGTLPALQQDYPLTGNWDNRHIEYAFQLSGNAAAPNDPSVPEPGTTSMLLGGGLTLVALRCPRR